MYIFYNLGNDTMSQTLQLQGDPTLIVGKGRVRTYSECLFYRHARREVDAPKKSGDVDMAEASMKVLYINCTRMLQIIRIVIEMVYCCLIDKLIPKLL